VPKLNQDVPNVKLWGVGFRHSISQYLPSLPIDIAAGLMYNNFTFGDIIDCKGMDVHAEASKTLSILTVYGGVQWEQSTVNLHYVSTTDNSSVSMSITGSNTFRFTAGLMISLGPIHLFGDANFGSVTALSAGIGFGG
jgi:hypothetical protein